MYLEALIGRFKVSHYACFHWIITWTMPRQFRCFKNVIVRHLNLNFSSLQSSSYFRRLNHRYTNCCQTTPVQARGTWSPVFFLSFWACQVRINGNVISILCLINSSKFLSQMIDHPLPYWLCCEENNLHLLFCYCNKYTILYTVTWPLNDSEDGGDLACFDTDLSAFVM